MNTCSYCGEEVSQQTHCRRCGKATTLVTKKLRTSQFASAQTEKFNPSDSSSQKQIFLPGITQMPKEREYGKIRKPRTPFYTWLIRNKWQIVLVSIAEIAMIIGSIDIAQLLSQ